MSLALDINGIQLCYQGIMNDMAVKRGKHLAVDARFLHLILNDKTIFYATTLPLTFPV